MSSVLADTHAIIWYLAGSIRLSHQDRLALDQAIQVNGLYLSSISLVEMRYLVEKSVIPQGEFMRLETLLDADQSPLILVALDRDVAWSVAQIPRDVVPDMPDRIIAATALLLNIPLVTHDHRIRNTPVNTIW